MKKCLAILLALCMLTCILLLPSCADSTKDPTGTPTPSGKVTDTPTPTEKEEPKIMPDLPDMSFNKDTVHFYQYDANGWLVWDDIYVEDRTGDIISDAVFDRNSYVEETYEVTFDLVRDTYTTYEANVRKAVDTGDDIYDVIFSMGHDIPRMYTANVFMNLYDVDYLDFEKPWWNQNCIESFTLAGYMPFTVSDMTILDKAVTACAFFNKQIAGDNGLGNLYDYVLNDNWTIETLINLGSVVAHDVNGDDVRDENDMFGIVCYDDPVEMLFHGSGCRYVSKDNDDYPVLTFADGDNFEIIQYYLEELMFDEDLTYNSYFRNVKDSLKMFIDNQGLFCITMIKSVKAFSEMESDFGILPIPKYDSTQEEYYSSSSVFGGNLISVPLCCGNTERAGFIIEALSAESKYTLIPAFYDTVLKDRSARDIESTEMLDIIINSMVFDVGDFYCLAGFTDSFLRITGNAHDAGHNTPARTSNIASFWETRELQVQDALENLIDIINVWNETN